MLPLFLQTLLGYPALQSGLTVSPRGLGALTASIVVGRLTARSVTELNGLPDYPFVVIGIRSPTTVTRICAPTPRPP